MEKCGIKAGAQILSINGHEVGTFNEFTFELGRLFDVYQAAETDAAREQALNTQLLYVHNGDTIATPIKLQAGKKTLTAGFYTTAMSDYKVVKKEYGFFESFPAGVEYGMNVLSGYVSDLKYVFTSDGAKSLGGFGTIGSLFPPMWDWYVFWKMTAFLSIILAFMNILPIPALDGGHVLFLLYEMITRRKPSEKFMIWAEYAGFGIVILLMLVANLNDILRWMGIM